MQSLRQLAYARPLDVAAQHVRAMSGQRLKLVIQRASAVQHGPLRIFVRRCSKVASTLSLWPCWSWRHSCAVLFQKRHEFADNSALPVSLRRSA